MGISILDIGSLLTPIIDRVFPDPKDKLDYEEKLATLADQEAAREHDEVMGQIQTNTVEAGNTNLFVAGWRPFVGWVCGVGVAYSFILEPLMEFFAKLGHYSGTFPALDMGNLMTLMMGMLGMGYLRTKEKLSGVPDSTPLVAQPPAQSAPTAQSPAKKKGPLGLPWPF